jgi:hypothetical protein
MINGYPLNRMRPGEKVKATSFTVVRTNVVSHDDLIEYGIKEKGFHGVLHFYLSKTNVWKEVPETETYNRKLFSRGSVLVFYEGQRPLTNAVSKFLHNNTNFDSMTIGDERNK